LDNLYQQQSCSSSAELQSQQSYNEKQQNQSNKTSQIHTSSNHHNSMRSSAYTPFNASTYQNKALQINKELNIPIEDVINSFYKRPNKYTSNKNYHNDITINVTFSAASHFQYTNQLELKEEQESSGIGNQQFELNQINYGNIDQEYDDQQSYHENSDHKYSDQEHSDQEHSNQEYSDQEYSD
ncbi:602_t:CDS:2, partial [Racocetra fulgida]